jgi:hypothetical protein
VAAAAQTTILNVVSEATGFGFLSFYSAAADVAATVSAFSTTTAVAVAMKATTAAATVGFGLSFFSLYSDAATTTAAANLLYQSSLPGFAYADPVIFTGL